jgi:hypothetical protein
MVSKALASLDAWLKLAEEVLAEQEKPRRRPAAEPGQSPETLESAGADHA